MFYKKKYINIKAYYHCRHKKVEDISLLIFNSIRKIIFKIFNFKIKLDGTDLINNVRWWKIHL